MVNSDNIFYQTLASNYNNKKNNYFDSYIISNNYSYLSYSIVGYYSFLASLGLKEILMSYPYFNMFLYFYLILTSIYYINIKYIKNNLINIILFLCIFAFIFLIYFYGSYYFGYLLYGNYTSSFFFGLLMIPSLFTSKNKKFHYKYIIPLVLVSMLFYNETALLCGVVYFITYFIFLLFMKRKIKGVFVTLPTLLCLILNLYFWICYYFSTKKHISESEITIFRLIPFIVYLIVLLLIVTILLDIIVSLRLKSLKNISLFYLKINNMLTLPKIRLLDNN
ncbi:hypothetical protein J6P52_06085 [bacterium]|nr:hypothetical protein [bacterium]